MFSLSREKDLGVNVVHIESRKSLRRGSEYEILVDVECDSKRMEQLMKMLSREVAAINLAHYEHIGSIPRAPSLSAATSFGECMRTGALRRYSRISVEYIVRHNETRLNPTPASACYCQYVYSLVEALM